MTELLVKLPDDLAQRARNAGLLTDGAIQLLLEDAVRREAGRRLLQVAERLHAVGVEPMNEEEVVDEVKTARAERRAREGRGQRPKPQK
jgi:post-segregation antitoxin (ccd killing protein)